MSFPGTANFERTDRSSQFEISLMTLLV